LSIYANKTLAPYGKTGFMIFEEYKQNENEVVRKVCLFWVWGNKVLLE